MSSTGAGWGSGSSKPRAQKEWAELQKRQEVMRQRADRESPSLLDRLRIWRTDRSLRKLVGAVRGGEQLVEGWREDFDRYHKGERGPLARRTPTAPGRSSGGCARPNRRALRDAERRGRATLPDLRNRDMADLPRRWQPKRASVRLMKV